MEKPQVIFSNEALQNYKRYRRIILNLLKYVPEKYFNNLKTINVTRAVDLSRNEKRTKIGGKRNKVNTNKCLGYYSRPVNGTPASITIYIDNIASYFKGCIPNLIPVMKYYILSETLYHEIGHHFGLSEEQLR